MCSSVVREGFWLPRQLREQVCSGEVVWEQLSFADGRECGRECGPDVPGAVTARWPVLTETDWKTVLTGLAESRGSAPQGREFWERLQVALATVSKSWVRPSAGPGSETPGATLRSQALEAIAHYTGYSVAMVEAMIGAPDMWDLGRMAAAFEARPTWGAVARWEPLAGLPGRVRFTPTTFGRMVGQVARAYRRPLFSQPESLSTVLGYGAGNVPGAALMIVFLALSTTLTGGAPPVVVTRNSRREPLFTPLVLSALEQVDEDLVSTVAVTVWDYNDARLQESLLSQADLVIAAAGDDTIQRLDEQIRKVGRRTGPVQGDSRCTGAGPGGALRAAGPRFHPHGHKVSFSTIGREMLARDSAGLLEGSEERLPGGKKATLLEAVAFLAGLDSVFWDQNGCLSSRVHFVEEGGTEDYTPFDYACALVQQLRRIALVLPRGNWPLRLLRDTFDRYKALEATGGKAGGWQVVSAYEDPFVVVFDGRDLGVSRLDAEGFRSLVNDCQGRVIVVRPVRSLMEVPRRYLSLLPRQSLQSLSVALGRPGEGLSPRFLEFAAACAARGVTAIRVVGRGAFPQLAYSWDGLLPLDLVCRRPKGFFTTIEFEQPFVAMGETYAALRRWVGEA